MGFEIGLDDAALFSVDRQGERNMVKIPVWSVDQGDIYCFGLILFMEGLPEVHFFDIEITSVFRFHHQKDGFQGRVGDDVLEITVLFLEIRNQE